MPPFVDLTSSAASVTAPTAPLNVVSYCDCVKRLVLLLPKPDTPAPKRPPFTASWKSMKLLTEVRDASRAPIATTPL